MSARLGTGLGARLAIALALALGLSGLGCRDRSPAVDGRLAVAPSLAGGAEGFARALAPRRFRFPADHGPHPGFRTEWWYYTGNLATAAGRRFGFELTFFRQGLAAHPPPRAAAWAASEIYLAHFALSDIEGHEGDTESERFRSFERVGRGALGLAGAEAVPFRVWLGTWSAAGPKLRSTARSSEPTDTAQTAQTADTATPMRLQAAEGDTAIDLTLAAGKPPVLEGDRGLSRKGSAPGQASYYYSLTRMPARGTLRAGGRAFAVTGLAWMDREWSTSSLGRDQVGWDWFALQLGDGRELMLYRLRRRPGAGAGGGTDPASQGTLVARDGTSRRLAWSDVRLRSEGAWTSPRSGARYPASWRLAVPGERLDLRIRPYLADQELDTSFRYWEGAVAVTGSAAGAPIGGSGYVELTGYGRQPRH
jgi:predicted secreted hydrolase